MKPVNEAAVTFLSRSANEGFARTTAACFAAQLDPTLEEVNDIKTAVSEAVTNCIVHAYPDTLGKVSMRLRMFEDNVLEIVVKDWGVGIADVEQARTPLFTTGDESRSGMGFTIMESFMDGVRVRSAPGKGTTVTLRRRISRRMGRLILLSQQPLDILFSLGHSKSVFHNRLGGLRLLFRRFQPQQSPGMALGHLVLPQ